VIFITLAAEAAAVEQLLIKLFHHIDFPAVMDTLPGNASSPGGGSQLLSEKNPSPNWLKYVEIDLSLLVFPRICVLIYLNLTSNSVAVDDIPSDPQFCATAVPLTSHVFLCLSISESIGSL
jgi:hypothetical protein